MSDRRALRHFARWWWIGLGLVLVVVVLSLVPVPPPPVRVRHLDKLEHVGAYFALMGYYAQLYRGRSLWVSGLALLALGAGLEWAQSLTRYRAYDRLDLLANTAGITLGLMLAHTRAANWLVRFETWLRR